MNIVKIGISMAILLIGIGISGAVMLDGDVAGGVITIQNGTETIELHLNECINESPRHWGYTYTVDANGTKTVREFNRSEFNRSEMMVGLCANETEPGVYTHRIYHSNATNMIEVSHNTSDDEQLKISRMPNFVDRLWTAFRGLW